LKTLISAMDPAGLRTGGPLPAEVTD
jgi:hypothetical protein